MSMNRAQPFQRFYPYLKITKSLCWEMREFCSVDLTNWLREQNVYFCLRFKRNHFRGRQAPLNLYRRLFSCDRLVKKISAYRQNNLKIEKVPGRDKKEGSR